MVDVQKTCQCQFQSHPEPWLPAFYLTFVEDNSSTQSAYVVWFPITAISLVHRDLKSCFADLMLLIQPALRTCSCLIDFQFSSIQFTYHPKKMFLFVFRVFFQIPGLFLTGRPFFFNSQFSRYRGNPGSTVRINKLYKIREDPSVTQKKMR